MTNPICPKCGSISVETKTRFGIRHDCCDLWSWGGAPLEDIETHNARKAAHAAFDPIWENGMLPRKTAYQLLAEKMSMPLDKCHIKLMSKEEASKVPEIANQIRQQLEEM